MESLPEEVVQCVMAAFSRHEDRRALACASRKFSAVYSNPNTWKLISEHRFVDISSEFNEFETRLIFHFCSTCDLVGPVAFKIRQMLRKGS
jgi:hypothetical protein